MCFSWNRGLDLFSALLRSWRPSDSAKNPILFSGRRKDPGVHLEPVLAFPTFLGRPSIVLPLKTVRWTVFGRRKGPSVCLGLVLALPIFPGSHPPSIVGADELNFCVRDGNRWTLIAINTNLCGWVLTIFVCQTIPRLTASGF